MATSFGNDDELGAYKRAVRLDRLEGGFSSYQEDDVDDMEYDELEEVEGKKKKRSSGSCPNKSNVTGPSSKKRPKKNIVGEIPKWLKPRSLASVLIEESARVNRDSIVPKYLNAEARPSSSTPLQQCRYPPRKFCPVTGLEGFYKDQKSGIPYATLKALEQIQERAPPWMDSGSTGSGGGSASYYEAVKSLRNE